MCGIFGVISEEHIINLLIDGLKRLEYRGYDSSGVATLVDNEFLVQKASGKIRNLEEKLDSKNFKGKIGIAHTRWATHGKPVIANAHPHISENLAIVHNGIIENFSGLRKDLIAKGYEFKSDTDTEVILYLLEDALKEDNDFKFAIINILSQLKGAFALGIIDKQHPDTLIAVKRGSPLAIGFGENETYIGSDAFVMAPLTNKICFLEDNDIAFIKKNKIEIMNQEAVKVERKIFKQNFSAISIGKENYRHYMLKEIDEQPTVLANILATYFDRINNQINFDQVKLDYAKINNVVIIACGTSLYSGEVLKYWLEKYANIAVRIYIASEFNHMHHLRKDDLTIFISQSGETADTLKALKIVKEKSFNTLVVVNSKMSSMENLADNIIYLNAGPEIGVASTKAFTSQLMVFALFALKISTAKEITAKSELKEIYKNLRSIPAKISKILSSHDDIKKIAGKIVSSNSVLYIGRGTSFGIAKEGALKLKELSYIHSEGIAAGELKHGPIALIDESLNVVAITPNDNLFSKTISSIKEIEARGGKIIMISDQDGLNQATDIYQDSIEMPDVIDFLSPILYSIPVQLLAYYVAVFKGTDVDQPRNLAKSVTVE